MNYLFLKQPFKFFFLSITLSLSHTQWLTPLTMPPPSPSPSPPWQRHHLRKTPWLLLRCCHHKKSLFQRRRRNVGATKKMTSLWRKRLLRQLRSGTKSTLNSTSTPKAPSTSTLMNPKTLTSLRYHQSLTSPRFEFLYLPDPNQGFDQLNTFAANFG